MKAHVRDPHDFRCFTVHMFFKATGVNLPEVEGSTVYSEATLTYCRDESVGLYYSHDSYNRLVEGDRMKLAELLHVPIGNVTAIDYAEYTKAIGKENLRANRWLDAPIYSI